MRTRWILTLAVVLIAGAGLAPAQTEWIDDPGNVVAPAEPGDWDAQRVINTVLEADGTYHLYFMGRDDPGADPLYWYWDIGHAMSLDGGMTWAFGAPNEPVLHRGAAGEWDDHAVACAAVIHDGTEFRMWYVGNDGEHGRVGYATSPDGFTWTKYEGNPVMNVGASGSFDDMSVWPGTVLFDGERYRMWYTGAHGTISSDSDWQIGYAESVDGLSWTKHPAPVLDPGVGWDGGIVYAPHVLFDGSSYSMWYTAVAATHAIGYAASLDGLHWTRHWGNPVVEGPGVGVGWGRVLHDPTSSVYVMWYANVDDYSWRRAWSACCLTTYLSHIPAAAFAAGAQGAFFQTDLELANADSIPVQFELWWLPRGENNSEPVASPSFNLDPGISVRYTNVLSEVFGLAPDALGALAVASSSPHLLAMSRTYNLPGDGDSGSFGQSMPAVTAEQLTGHGERRRILFATENADMRFNVGCLNASDMAARVRLELHRFDGSLLGAESMILLPWGNDQINRIFDAYHPVTGYVVYWSELATGKVHCYGSLLDNTTSDPTTVPPM